ncbi:MAG: type II secretion system protein J [Nitrospinaceae bacterium]
MRGPAPASREAGFTLLELIISLALIAVMGAVVLIGIRLAVTSQQVGERKTELYQRLRFIGDQLTEKIRSAQPLFVTGRDTPLFARLKQEQTKGKQILAFEGKKDSLKLITTGARLQDTGDQTPGLHEAWFYLGRNPQTRERGLVLMERPLALQTVMQDTRESIKDASYVTLAQDIRYLKFRYLMVTPYKDADVSGAGKERIKYEEKWVDTVFTEPLDSLGKKGSSLFDSKGSGEGRVSLPWAIEFSVGLLERTDPDDPDSIQVIPMPPTMIPIAAGRVFQRPEIKDAESKNTGA